MQFLRTFLWQALQRARKIGKVLKVGLILGLAYYLISFAAVSTDRFVSSEGNGYLLWDAVLVAGVLEEIVFRFGIYRHALRPHFGVAVSTCLSALLFTVVHIMFAHTSALGLMAVMAAGAIMALIYEVTQKIKLLILLHMLLCLIWLGSAAKFTPFIALGWAALVFVKFGISLLALHDTVIAGIRREGMAALEHFGKTDSLDRWLGQKIILPLIAQTKPWMQWLGAKMNSVREFPGRENRPYDRLYAAIFILGSFLVLVQCQPIIGAWILRVLDIQIGLYLVIWGAITAIRALQNRFMIQANAPNFKVSKRTRSSDATWRVSRGALVGSLVTTYVMVTLLLSQSIVSTRVSMEQKKMFKSQTKGSWNQQFWSIFELRLYRQAVWPNYPRSNATQQAARWPS